MLQQHFSWKVKIISLKSNWPLFLNHKTVKLAVKIKLGKYTPFLLLLIKSETECLLHMTLECEGIGFNLLCENNPHILMSYRIARFWPPLIAFDNQWLNYIHDIQWCRWDRLLSYENRPILLVTWLASEINKRKTWTRYLWQLDWNSYKRKVFCRFGSCISFSNFHKCSDLVILQQIIWSQSDKSLAKCFRWSPRWVLSGKSERATSLVTKQPVVMGNEVNSFRI